MNTHNRVEPQFSLIVSLFQMAIAVGCVKAEVRSVYYESKGEVATFSLDHNAHYLGIAVFVRLQDGSLQFPKLYYYQGHHTPIGVRKVEKVGDLSRGTTKELRNLRLPLSNEIQSYLLYIRTSYPEEVEKQGVRRIVYKFTDWSYMEVPAKDVSPDKPIKIPPFAELKNLNPDQEKVLKELNEMYSEARKAREAEAAKPITDRSEVPWYGQ